MAVSEIHPIKKTLRKAINYYKNPFKTDEGRLVSGINCTPEIAYEQFMATKEHWRKTSSPLAYVFLQSFVPGEVIPDLAHKLGIELGKRFLGENKYEFFVTTHINEEHIHNNIFFNSVSYTTGKKYHEHNNYKRLRECNDKLCREHSLSVIENPKEKGKSYKEWMEDKKGTSWKSQIKNDIDRYISLSSDFEDYISKMRESGYQIKRGKYTSYRPPGKERFVRGKTLGIGYTDDSIKAKIIINQLGGKHLFTREGEKPKKEKYLFISNSKYPFKKNESISDLLFANFMLAITILKAVSGDLKSPVYKNIKKPKLEPHEKKATQDRIKMLANQLFVIQNEQVRSKKDLNQKLSNSKKEFQESRENLKKCEKDLNKLKSIHDALENYQKYQSIAVKVQRSIQRKKLSEKYEMELRIYDFAKEQITDAGLINQVKINEFLCSYEAQKKLYELLKRDYDKAKVKVAALHELQDVADDLFEIKYMLRKEEQQQTHDSNRNDLKAKKKGR